MRLLLDTHIFLWAVAGSPALAPATRSAIESADAVFVSAVSIWEVAIKARLGKIQADADELAAAIEASGFVELPVRASHAAGVARLDLHQRPVRQAVDRSSPGRATQAADGRRGAGEVQRRRHARLSAKGPGPRGRGPLGLARRGDHFADISATVVSSMRFEKPHSLSYHDSTLTSRPSDDTRVCVASNTLDSGLWLKSTLTSGAVL